MIKQKKAAAKKSGSVAQAQKGNVYYDGDRSRLTERQKVSVRALEKLAQALGVDFISTNPSGMRRESPLVPTAGMTKRPEIFTLTSTPESSARAQSSSPQRMS